MCGRFSLIADLGELARRFEFDGNQLDLEPNYNVAPTQNILTVVGGENRRGGFMRWGLIPHWAKSASIGSRMINARAETTAQRPALPRRIQKETVPRPCRRLLRVAKGGECQETHPYCQGVGGNPSPSPAYGRCGKTQTATLSPHVPSSPRKPTTCFGPSTTACL